MRLVRFNENRLGILLEDGFKDVSAALDVIPQTRWPAPPGDALVAHLAPLLDRILDVLDSAPSIDLSTVRIGSPIANPSKIIAVPINYRDHVEEITRDPVMLRTMGGEIKSIRHYGLILKATSSLRGPGDGIQIAFPHRRNDHEVELAIIIGRNGFRIAPEIADSHVAGYAVGLDITMRGTEERGLRKSLDTYSILGPWLSTVDENSKPEWSENWPVRERRDPTVKQHGRDDPRHIQCDRLRVFVFYIVSRRRDHDWHARRGWTNCQRRRGRGLGRRHRLHARQCKLRSSPARS